MLFTIIIPTYNRAQYIKKALDSCLEQTYTRFEVIVVDDGSTDNTQEVVAQVNDCRIRYYKKRNEERARARNFGVELAQGDYIFFLDSDDTILPNHLEIASQKLVEYNKPEVFHSRYQFVNEFGEVIRKGKNLPDPFERNLFFVDNYLACLFFLRKDIALEYKFHESRVVQASEDYLLWLVLASRYKIRIINQVTVNMLEHSDRSVNVRKPESLINSLSIIVDVLKEDRAFLEWAGLDGIKRIESYFYQLAALRCVISRKKVRAWNLYYQAIKKNIYAIFSLNLLRLVKHTLKI